LLSGDDQAVDYPGASRSRHQSTGPPELRGFSRNLHRDWQAVHAGFTVHWSSGPVEGNINRLKLIKRQMYGRGGFNLLRKRVLLAS